MVQTDTHFLHFRRFGASGLDLARICAVLCEALRDAAMCTLFIVLYAPHYTCSLLNTTYYTTCYVASPPMRRTIVLRSVQSNVLCDIQLDVLCDVLCDTMRRTTRSTMRRTM